MKRIINSLLIGEHELMEGAILPPWYYGYGYRLLNKNVTVYLPIPINYIVRLCVRVQHHWDRFRSRPSWVDIQIQLGISISEGNAKKATWEKMEKRGKEMTAYLKMEEEMMAYVRAMRGGVVPE